MLAGQGLGARVPGGGAISQIAGRLSGPRGSALLGNGGPAFFVATGVANVANFAFHVVMSRMLGPATYGALGSILGLSTVVTLAVTAFQAAVTQSVAEEAEGLESVRRLHVARSLRRSVYFGAGLLGLVAAVSPLLRSFLHLSSPVPVVLFGAFTAGTVVSLVPQGVLIGRLEFRFVALSLAIGAVVRVAAGPLFVKLGWGLSGAVAATVLNAAVTLGVLLWPLRHEIAATPGTTQLQVHIRSAMLAVVSLGGVSAFLGTDIFLARHFLPGARSGYYVAAATAARTALFLPAAIGVMAFPRLAAQRGRGPEARAVLRHAVVAVSVLGAAAAAVVAAVPHLVIDVLFGSRYAPAAPALRVLAGGAAAVGVTTVLVYALLARRAVSSTAAWAAIAAAAVAISFMHSSVTAVAWVMLIVNLVLLAVLSVAVVSGAAGNLHTGEPSGPATTTGGNRA
ncbi:MAG: oligosaccharide flippase family protein [Acidimicrobiales bacterium]